MISYFYYISEKKALWESILFLGRNDAEAATPVLWPPHAKSWIIGKDSDAGRDWGQEEKGMTEDEMAGWHHGLNECGSGWTPGDGDGQGGLACCDSWGCKESDTTEWLNWCDHRANSLWGDKHEFKFEKWWLWSIVLYSYWLIWIQFENW